MTKEIAYKGTCPKCGGPLVPKLYVQARKADGTPDIDDSSTEPWCNTCKVFWIDFEDFDEEPGIQPDAEDFPGILEDEEQ